MRRAETGATNEEKGSHQDFSSTGLLVFLASLSAPRPFRRRSLGLPGPEPLVRERVERLRLQGIDKKVARAWIESLGAFGCGGNTKWVPLAWVDLAKGTKD